MRISSMPFARVVHAEPVEISLLPETPRTAATGAHVRPGAERPR